MSTLRPSKTRPFPLHRRLSHSTHILGSPTNSTGEISQPLNQTQPQIRKYATAARQYSFMMSCLSTGPVIGTSHSSLVPDISIPVLSSTSADVSPLPAGFPAQANSNLAWVGSDFTDESSYIYHLTEADRAEISAAIIHFKALELDGERVSCDTFPLPALGGKLYRLSCDIHCGRGFCLIRGINPASYTVEDLMLVYLGVQAYIADQRGRQDSRGNMLVHIVANNTTNTSASHHRHSNKAITFHNEETGDIVGWLTRTTAASGGRCIIASAYTIYNVLALQQPDLLRLLSRSDWPFALPVIFYRDSKLVMNFGRTALLGNTVHPRPKNLPRVSERQLEALDAVEAIAQAMQLEIQTQAGDMHFINNLAILHRRESFVDGAAALEKRHLVRMRLRSSDLGWSIPQELRGEWSRAFDGEGRKVWQLEPMPEAYFPLRKYPN